MNLKLKKSNKQNAKGKTKQKQSKRQNPPFAGCISKNMKLDGTVCHCAKGYAILNAQ